MSYQKIGKGVFNPYTLNTTNKQFKMEIKKLLRDLKLNKYEADAYSVILERAIVEASEISKEGKIPFGKIYESLRTLTNKGLIEVQDTRPKKYKVKKPQIAFKKFLEDEKEESEKRLEKTKNTIMQLEEKISKIDTQEPQEKIFWTTAIGEEIEELIKSNFLEAEKEICMLPYTSNKKDQQKHAVLNIPFFIKEIIKAKSRGVKIRALLPKEFARLQIKIFKTMGVLEKITKHIEIRIQEGPAIAPFTIIDLEKVVLRVDDPTDQNKILAMIKISDSALAEKLKTKFDKMWGSAKPV